MDDDDFSLTAEKVAYAKWALHVLKWSGDRVARKFCLNGGTVSRIRRNLLKKYENVEAVPWPGAPEPDPEENDLGNDTSRQDRNDA